MNSSLTDYKKKRSLNKTPEPRDGKPAGSKLRFVVQKHAASRLHYDFRIEVNGVLKSWAVPKGPSMNPADKRLAMMVEDHPYDYLDFEGIIPRENYGAGTVIVWDQGTYELVKYEKAKKSEQEKLINEKLDTGALKIRLFGERLHGEFVLRRTSDRAENAWILFKRKDDHASEVNVTEEDTSIVSGKTLEEVAADEKSRKWTSNRNFEGESKKEIEETPVSKVKQKLPKEKADTNAEHQPDEALKFLKGKKKTAMPVNIEPMLATLVNKPVDGDWIYEVKWDGFRSLVYKEKEKVNICSRNNKPFNDKFYPLHKSLSVLSFDAVLDGEIVVLNEKGLPDFATLQTWRSEADGRLVYFVFDLLWFEGVNLMNMPLNERREILRQVIPNSEEIKMSDDFKVKGEEFFTLVDKMGLEGMVAKKADSIYEPGQRTKSWLKIKTQKYQETIVGGYTINEGTSRKFSSLLMGLFENGEFVFTGAVGTGFTNKMQEDILKRLKPLQIKECPFNEVPEYNKPSRFRPNPPKAEVVWVKPEVVAEINYRTVASDGSYRHPSFKGIREDKNPDEVVREQPLPTQEIVDENAKSLESKIVSKDGKRERKTLLNPSEETQPRSIGDHELKFPNLSKIFWPEEGVTKRDMLNNYYQVAPYMLPYLKDRPQTMNRYPNGIYGKSFYQKDVTGKVASWLPTFTYYSETDKREKKFPVCTDEASLLYIASLGCIEINPWSSRTQNPDHPDWCIIDLDPDKNPFEQVIEAACVTHQILDAIGVPNFCKTSGSTGLHIYIPLAEKYTYEDSKEFGRALVKLVHSQIPKFTSIERLTSNRKGKIYLDFLQNRPQATVAAPYSLRPKPGAPVSMPLHWEEVKKGLKILDFTIFNAMDRLKYHGDIFSGVLKHGINIEKTKEKLKKIK